MMVVRRGEDEDDIADVLSLAFQYVGVLFE